MRRGERCRAAPNGKRQLPAEDRSAEDRGTVFLGCGRKAPRKTPSPLRSARTGGPTGYPGHPAVEPGAELPGGSGTRGRKGTSVVRAGDVVDTGPAATEQHRPRGGRSVNGSADVSGTGRQRRCQWDRSTSGGNGRPRQLARPDSARSDRSDRRPKGPGRPTQRRRRGPGWAARRPGRTAPARLHPHPVPDGAVGSRATASTGAEAVRRCATTPLTAARSSGQAGRGLGTVGPSGTVTASGPLGSGDGPSRPPPEEQAVPPEPCPP